MYELVLYREPKEGTAELLLLYVRLRSSKVTEPLICGGFVSFVWVSRQTPRPSSENTRVLGDSTEQAT